MRKLFFFVLLMLAGNAAALIVVTTTTTLEPIRHATKPPMWINGTNWIESNSSYYSGNVRITGFVIVDGANYIRWNISGSKYLQNESVILDVNETVINDTVDARLVSVYYNVTTYAIVAGTAIGNLQDTWHPDGAYDGKTLNLTEAAGPPGLDVRMNYTDIESFNKGVMRYRTSSLAGDYPVIQVWNYNTGKWEDYPPMVESESFATIEQSVFDSSDHVTGEIVQMRVYKAANGNINNKYYIDWIAIIKGLGTPSPEEVDPIWKEQEANIYSNLTYLMNNASDQDGRIITLEEQGSAPQDNNITILYENASDQDARIIEEELSTSTMSGNITLLWANATEQYEYGLYVNGRAGDNAQAIVFIDQFINVLFENASDQYERILAEELSTSRMSGNITVLYENASDQDGRIITLESAGVGLDADIQAGLSYWDLNTSKGGLNISDADMLRVGSAGDDKEIKIRHDDTDGVINCSSGILNSFASGFENYDQNRRGGANEYLYKIGVSASTGDTSFIFAPEARSNGIKANCLGDFRIFNETCNFRVRSQLGDIYFDPIVGAKGSLRPEDNKEDDLGEADISWDNCYCDDYVTTSRGFLSSSTSAIDTVKILRTNPDGEVNHDTVSKSLEGEAGHGTLSVGALGMANSQAIKELEEIILAQNDRIKLLEAEKTL